MSITGVGCSKRIALINLKNKGVCVCVCVQLHIVAAIFFHNDGETKKLIIGQDVKGWFLFVLGTYPQESM